MCISYDIVGDITIIRLREASKIRRRKIAEALMSVHKNVKTVFAQTGAVCGDFRLRKLEYIAGERVATTVHRESRCLFSVDVEKCYFSPRLSYERMRIARQVRKGEVVVNMFAGVGCFSILITKHSGAEKVYSIDVDRSIDRSVRRGVHGKYREYCPTYRRRGKRCRGCEWVKELLRELRLCVL